MNCMVRGGLRIGEKVGGSKKRVHFSDEGPVRLGEVCASVPEFDQIGAATSDTKSCRFADKGPGLVEVFAKTSITCDVNSCTSAGFRQFGAIVEGQSCHYEEYKSSSAETLEKAATMNDRNLIEFISCDSPSCGSYGLAIWDNGKPNRSNSHVKGVQRKLTFVVGAGDQMSRKYGFTSKKTSSRGQHYKVVPESEGKGEGEGAFPTAFLTPQLNAMHTLGFPEGTCKKRCAWITPHSDAVYVAYHDEEWGVPVHEDRRLFELLVLAGAQSEIAWSSILSKREACRDAFAQFDPAILAKYDTATVASQKSQHDIMKSEARVRSIVSNAKVVMKIVEEFGSFNEYLWRFVSYKPILSKYKQAKSIPMRTAKSEAISKDLQRRGMRHTGPMVIYSFMQAAGLANDHLVSCFRHQYSSSPPSATKPLVCC